MGKSVNLFATIAVAMLASFVTLLLLPKGPAQGASFPQDSRFTDSPFVSELTHPTDKLTHPTDMEFAPDGRLFVAEQAGKVHIAKTDGTLVPFPFLDITSKVDSTDERGLMAVSFDPNFSTNHYVYLYYTRKATATTSVHNRVVRVTASGDTVVAGSEKLIFRLDNQDNTHHMGGALDFGKNGKLYISTGDNVGGNTQTLQNLLGKILRINKDGTIPTNNPFYSTASGNNRAIWALGLRNPFKFAVKPGTNTFFINDVGADAWEEIDRGAPGANYGWNIYEGPEVDPDYVNPIFAYGHDGEVASTGCSITGGTFYNPTTVQFPSDYIGDYFFADFCSGWIRRLQPSPGGGFAASEFAKGLEKPIDLEVSEAGELYYLTRGSTASPAFVGKIAYAG